MKALSPKKSLHANSREAVGTIQKVLTTVFLLALVLLPIFALAQEASVTQLAPNVYHFRYGFHSNIFIVTDEGVIATDPLSPAAAKACLAEIRKITDQPVRYVIYSHDHTDHIAGGGVYQGEVQFIAHQNARALIEARGIDEIIVPDLLVGDRYLLELGGRKIQLAHFGRIESTSGLAIYLPADKILMWVDAVRSFGVPYRYLEGYDWLEFRSALRELQTWDIEILVPGHGPPTDKSRLILFANYLRDMQNTAEQEMAAYPQSEHSSNIGKVNPERYFDSYISEIASRVIEKMRPQYGDMGGYDDWGTKNAERAVVFLLHEILFFK